jgi:hypothetical protein
MTSDRHVAYCRAKSQIEELAASKLLPTEHAVLQGAADDLLLTNDPREARAAFAQAKGQLEQLIDNGRWTEPMIAPLLDALAKTGRVPVAV